MIVGIGSVILMEYEALQESLPEEYEPYLKGLSSRVGDLPTWRAKMKTKVRKIEEK